MQNEINLFAFESWAFWTGIAAVGVTAASALLGCLMFWFSSKVNSLKDEMRVAEETKAKTLTETISHLKRSANWTGKTAVAFTAAGALFGCLSWWSFFSVSDTKEKARMRFESDYAAKMKAAENDLIKSRQETAKALADVAAANERTSKLEVETARLREQVARAEIELMKVKRRIERRAISDAQRTRLEQALESIQKGPIKIIALLGDEEAGKFAKEMSDILKDAGWIDIHVSRGVFSGGIDGFEIRIRDREKIPVFALQIARVFDSIGFEPSLVLDPSVAEGAMEIIIGMNADSG